MWVRKSSDIFYSRLSAVQHHPYPSEPSVSWEWASRPPRRALLLYQTNAGWESRQMVSASLGTNELHRQEGFQILAAFRKKPKGVRQRWLRSPLFPPQGKEISVSGLRVSSFLYAAWSLLHPLLTPWAGARAQPPETVCTSLWSNSLDLGS